MAGSNHTAAPLFSCSRNWDREVSNFMNRALEDEGIDYWDADLNAKLDAEVKRLAKDPDNSHRQGIWFLNTAHRLCAV